MSLLFIRLRLVFLEKQHSMPMGVGSGGQGGVAPVDFHTWYIYSR